MDFRRVAAAGEADTGSRPATVLHPHAGAHLMQVPVHTLVLVFTAQRVHVLVEPGLGVVR